MNRIQHAAALRRHAVFWLARALFHLRYYLVSLDHLDALQQIGQPRDAIWTTAEKWRQSIYGRLPASKDVWFKEANDEISCLRQCATDRCWPWSRSLCHHVVSFLNARARPGVPPGDYGKICFGLWQRP